MIEELTKEEKLEGILEIVDDPSILGEYRSLSGKRYIVVDVFINREDNETYVLYYLKDSRIKIRYAMKFDLFFEKPDDNVPRFEKVQEY